MLKVLFASLNLQKREERREITYRSLHSGVALKKQTAPNSVLRATRVAGKFRSPTWQRLPLNTQLHTAAKFYLNKTAMEMELPKPTWGEWRLFQVVESVTGTSPLVSIIKKVCNVVSCLPSSQEWR
jgi:hypothetical protein